MKISNIILLSFFLFLFGGIIALYLGSKYYSDYYDATKFVSQEKPLPPFSVVVAEPGAIFNLRSEKENRIIQPHRKETVANFPAFIVRNDTLFISSAKQIQGLPKNYRVVAEISCVRVKSIITKENSDVHLEKFETDTLDISMNKSRLDWRFDKAAYVSIQAKDSDIYLEGEKIKNLAVKLDKTKLRISLKKRMNYLSGSLKNDSGGDFSLSNSVHLDADKTSNYGFYNFVN